jgi:hypothetical protein
MFVNVHVVRGVLLDVLHIVLLYMLRTDVVFYVTRWQHVFGAGRHLVGIYPFVSGDVDGQRIVTQTLHLVGGQIPVSLVAQDRIFSCEQDLRQSRNRLQSVQFSVSGN